VPTIERLLNGDLSELTPVRQQEKMSQGLARARKENAFSGQRLNSTQSGDSEQRHFGGRDA
jgi:hypothetical protein